MTINIRGLGTAPKRDSFLHELNENLDYGIFLLQETHISCKTQADLVTLARKSAACRPLSPIFALLIFFAQRIRKRFLLLGLIRIFPRLLASSVSVFLPLSFSRFAEINVSLVPFPIMIFLIYLFLQSMFLFMEAVFGSLTVLFFPMMIFLIL